jgi:mannose-6-phosphate isomerase class I
VSNSQKDFGMMSNDTSRYMGNTYSDRIVRSDRPLTVEPMLKNYSWGPVEGSAEIHQLFQGHSGPLAEAWFGPYGRADVGDRLREAFGLSNEEVRDLPLVKILQAHQPLSIQVHPPEYLARQLHEVRPHYYPDNRGKYEAALALNEFKLLYNVLGFDELSRDFSEGGLLSPLFTLLSEDLQRDMHNVSGGNRDAWCRNVYCNLLTITPERQAIATKAVEEVLAVRLADDGLINASSQHSRVERLGLAKEYAKLFDVSDPGIIATLLMNVVTLRKGQTLDIEPGIPHAYLPGAFMVEVMVPSDNVLRVGLTPKEKDPENLPKCLLTLKPGLEDAKIGEGDVSNPYFLIRNFELAASGSVTIEKSPHTPLVLVTKGSVLVDGVSIKAGEAVYVAPNRVFELMHSANCHFCVIRGQGRSSEDS